MHTETVILSLARGNHLGLDAVIKVNSAASEDYPAGQQTSQLHCYHCFQAYTVA